MKPESQKAYEKMCESLEDLIKVYRALLEIVRKEKEILVSANIDDLNENNKAKEAMLMKVRALEHSRVKFAVELAQLEGLNSEKPRLMDLAAHLEGQRGDRLRQIHSVLELLLKRVQDYNRQNEILVKSALDSITGAVDSIRDSLVEKPTYTKPGEKPAVAQSGQLVSREA